MVRQCLTIPNVKGWAATSLAVLGTLHADAPGFVAISPARARRCCPNDVGRCLALRRFPGRRAVDRPSASTVRAGPATLDRGSALKPETPAQDPFPQHLARLSI